MKEVWGEHGMVVMMEEVGGVSRDREAWGEVGGWVGDGVGEGVGDGEGGVGVQELLEGVGGGQEGMGVFG
ncbi:hypothetical protein, partial [Micrococcus luteus]|uniref:hypothetical protein n=1 Tax=Micrococcus luteus TaxID=1270 RepID=UPI001C92D012